MKKYIIILIGLGLLAAACQREEIPEPRTEIPEENGGYPLEDDQAVAPGVLQIKLDARAAERFAPERAGTGASTGVEAIDRLVDSYGVYRITRTFPPGGANSNPECAKPDCICGTTFISMPRRSGR